MSFHSFLASLSRKIRPGRRRRVRYVEEPLPPTTVAREITPIVLPGKCLDDIPDDVIHLVIEAMKERDDWIKSIRSLSLASQRLRVICLPYLFRDHCWRSGTWRKGGRQLDLLPARFWGYIRFFHLIVDPTPAVPAQGRNCFSLMSALPRMVSLTRFKVSGNPHRYAWAWANLLSGIASIPSLRSLEFVCSLWSFAPVYPSSFASPPSRLVLHLHGGDFFTPFTELAGLRHMFLRFSERLEYLELCGDSMQLDLLKTLNWPALRELVICGHPIKLSVSLSKVLTMMPKLSVLDIRYQCKPESGSLVLWPSTNENPSDRFLSELTSLTITNPSISDNIFKHISPYLLSLSIHSSSYAMPFDRDELLQLLRVLPAKNLTALRLSVSGKISAHLFTFIGSTFPCLETLGIHRTNTRSQPAETPDELGASLRGLDCLKRLKLLELDIGFPAYPYMTDEDLSLRAWAMSAANAIPRIQRVAFATPLTYFNHHWVTFDIVDRPEHKPGEDRFTFTTYYEKLSR